MPVWKTWLLILAIALLLLALVAAALAWVARRRDLD